MAQEAVFQAPPELYRWGLTKFYPRLYISLYDLIGDSQQIQVNEADNFGRLAIISSHNWIS